MMFRSGVGIVLIAACCAAAAQTALPERNPASAAEAVRYFIDLVKDGQVEAASKLAEGVSTADLKQAGEQMRGGKTSVSVVDSREDGDLAIVIVNLVDEERTQYNGGPLVKRDGRWILARDPEGKLDDAGKDRLRALQKWSDERCQELQKSLPSTRPAAVLGRATEAWTIVSLPHDGARSSRPDA